MSEQMLEEAIERAQTAFWGRITNYYPEVKTGDFGPEETFRFDRACEDAVKTWLRYNLPVDEINVGDDVVILGGGGGEVVDKIGVRLMVRTHAHEWHEYDVSELAKPQSPRARNAFLFES